MLTHILPTEEPPCIFNELASPRNHGCAVDTLSVSLQSCEPFSVTGSDSSNNLVIENITRTDNLADTFNSIVTIESDGQTDDVGINDVRLDDASEAIVPEIVQPSIRRSTCKSKFKRSENQKAARKSSRIADKKALLELVFLKVARRERSGLRKQARSSSWGSLKHITEVFKQNTGNDVNQNTHKKSLKSRAVQRGGKRNKDRKNQSSQSPNGEIPAISRCICFKVKLPKEASPSRPSNMLSSTDKDPGTLPDNLGGVMTKSLKLGVDSHSKLSKEEVVSSLRSESLNENLNKAAVLPKVSSPDVPPLDPGTSPESEVINVNPDSQISGIVSEDGEDVLILSKDVGHGDLTRLSPSETSSEKGRLIDTLYHVSNSGGEGGLPAKMILNNCALYDKHGQNAIIGDIVQSCPETGIDVVDDLKYGCRSGSSSLNMLPSGFGDQHGSPRNAWVCCDDCFKWRRIPAVLADSIEASNGRWICTDNLDKAFAECSIPQEMSNEDINAELEISDEDKPVTHLNFNPIVQKQHTVPVQAPWKLIKSNLFLHRNRKNQSIDEVMVCQCKPPVDGRKGCRDGCLNRMLNIECAKGTCPCGDLCSNQQFQKRKYAKLKCFRCGKKGFGLQAQEDIPKGRFLIEYVGEVLDMHAHEARQREYASKGHKHFYFMTLNGSEVIDACAKGNLGRFINHSCEPNCQTEKWMVNGEVCIGLFAMRDIKKGEEVTFDYNYVRVFGAAARKCVCGSSLCRGYIGGDPQSTEVIVEGDSDDEYPEPVMHNDGLDKLDKLMPGTTFFDDIQVLSLESLPKNNVDVEKCTTAVGHLEITKEKKPPASVFEEKAENSNSTTTVVRAGITSANEGLMFSFDALKSEPSFELGGKLGLLPSVQHVTIPLQTNEGKIKITSEEPSEYSIGEDDHEKPSLCTIERIETSSLSSTMSNLSPATSKVKKKSKSIKDKTTKLTSKSHARTKSSSPSSLVKGGKPKNNSVNFTKPPQIENHSSSAPCKSKKLSQVPLDGRFEAVQQRLNELLDADGGISKLKDSSRGYLKLLYQTAASGDSGNGEGIQSNRDLSMILDALLKTKSRTVLADILNKNGLQMLHNILKRYRKEFNKIPILRKLLKVFEYLAVREILTLENINRCPPRPGVVSFKESILEFTEHRDKQVHQIARSFRDKWIHRKRRNFGDRGVDRKDLQRGSKFIRSSASRDSSSDRDRRPMEAIDNCANKSSSTNTPPLDCGIVEGSSASCSNNCIPSEIRTRKRKRRWDQPADTTSPSNKEPKIDQVNSEGKIICQKIEKNDVHNETQDEDAPPGFSSPLKGNLVQSNVSKIGTDAVMGEPQERFISRMTISYGVPLPILHQLEIPHHMVAESWVVAPAMPFQPFPPLPLHPRDISGPQSSSSSLTVNLPTQEQAFQKPVFQSDRNQNTPTTSGTGPHNMAIPGPTNQPSFQGGGGSSNNLGRKYFRQQKWNNPRNRPPWVQRNDGWGGFKGPINSSNGMGNMGMANGMNGPHGHYNSGVVNNGSLSNGTGFSQQPQQYN